MKDLQAHRIDLHNKTHQNAVFHLMNVYMMDPMGNETPLEKALFEKLLVGLQKQANYVGFLIESGGRFIALANCFINFSTFKAMPLLNIHDFVVDKTTRGKGAGRFLMKSIKQTAAEMDCCTITLEVRHDNYVAQHLYRTEGFSEGKPGMFFWKYYNT